MLITNDIIEACKRNERVAQKLVYENFFNKMFSVCRRYLRNEEEALEVLNDGFISIFQNIKQFKGEGSFEGWIRKVIINKALDHIKMNKKYKEMLSYVEDYTEDPSFADAGIIDSCDIEELYNSIHSLPLIYQMVFNLYAIEGFSHKEIAEKIEISEGTSRWYLSESRKMLKEKISILLQQA